MACWGYLMADKAVAPQYLVYPIHLVRRLGKGERRRDTPRPMVVPGCKSSRPESTAKTTRERRPRVKTPARFALPASLSRISMLQGG